MRVIALDEWNVAGRVSLRHLCVEHQVLFLTHKSRTLSFAPSYSLLIGMFLFLLLMNPAADNLIHLFHYFSSFYDAIGRVAVAVFPSGDSFIYPPVTHAISAAGTLEDHCI